MASQAARRMGCGVSKSGSPRAKLLISRPWRRNSAARSEAALLGEGLMRSTRAAIRDGFMASCPVRTHGRDKGARARVSWLIEEFLGRRAFHHAAAIQHDDAVR